MIFISFFTCLKTKVGIYKRKQESKKKERKHALDQETDPENDKGINKMQFA